MNFQRISFETFVGFISNLNILLLLVGFPIFTLFAYGTAEVQVSNLPSVVFRACHLGIAVLIIALSKDRYYLKPASLLILLFVFFTCRILYDGFVRIDSCDMPLVVTQQLLLESIGFTFIPVLAIAYSFAYVNINKVLRLTYWGLLLMMVVFLLRYLSGAVMVGNGRVSLSVAQSTLALAKFGGWLFLFSYANLKTTQYSTKKVLYITSFILGLFCSFIAGSRGAAVGSVVALFYLFLSFNNKNIHLIISIGVLLVILILWGDKVLSLLANIFPVLFGRLEATIDNGDTSGRDVIFKIAYQRFCDNPILGDWFIVGSLKSSTNSAHNLTLEVASSLGLIGLIVLLLLYIKLLRAINFLRIYPTIQILCALCICMFVMSLSGGSITSPDYSTIFMIVVLVYYKFKNQEYINEEY